MGYGGSGKARGERSDGRRSAVPGADDPAPVTRDSGRTARFWGELGAAVLAVALYWGSLRHAAAGLLATIMLMPLSLGLLRLSGLARRPGVLLDLAQTTLFVAIAALGALLFDLF